MANPQKENGYTAIANEILEQIVKLTLNGTQYRIIIVVWRYTYGFSRKEAELSESYIAKACKVHKKQVQRELNELITFNIIKVVKEATFKSTRIVSFNKDFDSWQVTKKIPPNRLDTHTGSGLAPTPKFKENAADNNDVNGLGDISQIPVGGSGLAPQESNIKTNIKTISINECFEKLWQRYPKKKGKGQVSNTQKEKLYIIGYEELLRCIERCKKDKKDTDMQYWQNGSTFFNSGYIDYLDANFEDETQIPEVKPLKLVIREL